MLKGSSISDLVSNSVCDIFIGPESDHWLCLSLTALTDSLTDCRLVNLIDVTLACANVNSKLVEVVTVWYRLGS